VKTYSPIFVVPFSKVQGALPPSALSVVPQLT
jgi:hypothetical protein